MSFQTPNLVNFVAWADEVNKTSDFKRAVIKYGSENGMNPSEIRYFANNFIKKSSNADDLTILGLFLENWNKNFAVDSSDNDNIFEFKTFNSYKREALYEALVVSETDEEKLNCMTELFLKEFEENPEIIENIDEGFLSSLVGGVAGFFIGPTIGKIIANALGIEKGILYDMFTSKLVGTSLGMAISKHLGKGNG